MASLPRRNFDRRNFVKLGAAAAAAPWLSIRAGAQNAAQTADPTWRTQTLPPYVEVEITSGRIRGGHSRGALAFKGIPYAGSVSGKNRFKAPPKVNVRPPSTFQEIRFSASPPLAMEASWVTDLPPSSTWIPDGPRSRWLLR